MTKKKPTPEETVELLLDTLADVINQAAHGPDGNLDSQDNSAYADGLRVLAQFGRVGIIDEWGKRVIATWPDVDA